MLLAFIEVFDQRIHEWALTLGWPMEGAIQLVLAGIAGGLVGLEREVRGRQAGFRTNMLVCIGSALVMIVSTRFASVAWTAHPGVNINIDPARIAYGVMTGIGFLGAGTILQHRGSIRGLTTAAGLWCVAAVGLSIGFGEYSLSAAATILILVSLWVLDYVEEIIPKVRHRTVTVRTKYYPGCIGDVVATFKKSGLAVIDAGFERTADRAHADIHLHVAFVNSQQYYSLERQLEGEEKYDLLAVRDQ